MRDKKVLLNCLRDLTSLRHSVRISSVVDALVLMYPAGMADEPRGGQTWNGGREYEGGWRSGWMVELEEVVGEEEEEKESEGSLWKTEWSMESIVLSSETGRK